MVLEDKRTETQFEVRDHMLDIWKQITELCFRGFGLKKRKIPKEPKNFAEWSEKSKEKWLVDEQEKYNRKLQWDNAFIVNESRVLDNLCRKIVYTIDQANTIKPQYLCECDKQRLLQDEAIGLCNNLKRELNHVAATISCNLNFLTIQTESVEKEIALLRAWRKSCNSTRTKVIAKEIEVRSTAAKKNRLHPWGRRYTKGYRCAYQYSKCYSIKTWGNICTRANYQLQSVNSASNAANVNNNGNANNNGSANANGVQPRFRFFLRSMQ